MSKSRGTRKSEIEKDFAVIREGKKLFKCEICDHRLSHKASMDVASVHGNKKPFKCEICEYTCSLKGTLSVMLSLANLSIQRKIQNYMNF